MQHLSECAELLRICIKHTRKPLYVQKICKMLLSEQLLRPHGIIGLFSSVFGEDISSSEAPLEKLQSTSDVLNSLPYNVTREVPLFNKYLNKESINEIFYEGVLPVDDSTSPTSPEPGHG